MSEILYKNIFIEKFKSLSYLHVRAMGVTSHVIIVPSTCAETQKSIKLIIVC